MILRPKHYQMEPEPYEVIKAWDLGFEKGNALKYIARAGRKDGNSEEDDLFKAIDYLQKRIEVIRCQKQNH